MSGEIEVSVVIPCLDEVDTVSTCVDKALRGLANAGCVGEVIVADNGSTDGSQARAEHAGARVLTVSERGYGNALHAGIAAARGRYVVMGDADDSYDFLEIPKFVDKLRQGFDLVQGCRLPSGGGRVLPGAMPRAHYWIGNPLFSNLAKTWFGSPVHDVYCGLRGFRRDFQMQLEQRCAGMEFAIEMVLRASLFGARIAEIPVTLHPDGRRSRRPHLRTLRDGWRTLRLLLLYSPRWLFLWPGLALSVLGLLGFAVALPGLSVAGVTFDAHTLLVASLAMVVGFQAILFFLVTKCYAISEGLLPPDPRLQTTVGKLQLERGLLAGAGSVILGSLLIASAAGTWIATGLGQLDYAVTMRQVIPGATLVCLGVQAAFGSFLVSLLTLPRRR